jgi:XTP/dITP diphosphohydrolase
VLVAIGADGAEIVAEGRVDGTIAAAPRGTSGFGYDPIFVPAGETRTIGELSAAEKDALSHRGRAAAVLRAALGR